MGELVKWGLWYNGTEVNHFKGVQQRPPGELEGEEENEGACIKSIYYEIPTIIVFRTVITSNRTFY